LLFLRVQRLDLRLDSIQLLDMTDRSVRLAGLALRLSLPRFHELAPGVRPTTHQRRFGLIATTKANNLVP
jgi:hypothetical protein